MAKLLIVDDEEETCEVFRTAFTQVGHSVRTCRSGAEAIEAYRRERMDLVFCDLKLPGVDGLVVLEAIKAIDPWATVIMVTAYGTVDVATRSLRLGAYDFIEKPCTIAQLQEVSKRALEHRREMKQLTLLQGKPGTAADIPARLVELEQLKADFLTMIIQELRTPMRQMDETLTLVRQGFYGSWEDPKKQRFLDQLSRVGTSLSRLFLSGFALFLSHEQRVSPTEADLIPLLEEIFQQVRVRCHEKELTLNTELDVASLKGPTDMEKVAYVIRELLDNAIQFTLQGGTITVTCGAAVGGFRVQVIDTGPGIPLEEQGDLFTVFRQSGSDRRLRKRKSGLGLPLVRHYVDLLNGFISLESSPDLGSRFTVIIPWWSPEPSQQKEESPSSQRSDQKASDEKSQAVPVKRPVG